MRPLRLLSIACFVVAVLTPALLSVRPVSAHPNVPILLYHHIEKGRTRWHVSPQKFEQQLAFLAANGYHTVSMTAYLDAVQNDTPLPDKPVVLTFDDGYRDNYVNAFPLLKKYVMIGTFFIVTGQVGYPASMTWDEIAEMQRAGMEIGAHTIHHPFLTRLPALRAFTEIFMSRLELMTRLKTPIQVFAYPYNDYNETVAGYARLAGFRAACIVAPHKGYRAGNLFEIPRLTVLSRIKLKSFSLMVGWATA